MSTKSPLASYLKKLRTQFNYSMLDEKTVSKSPFIQFGKWMQQAIDANCLEPNAMTLATSARNGFVDARIVLLRGFSNKGFNFYTNYKSQKGRELRQNKQVCVNFFWPEVQRQVRVRGTVEKLSARDSNSYFWSRPRESQLAAWASHQSEMLIDRNELENRYNAFEKEFANRKIPRPPHWGGFRIKPVHFEFWQGRTNRLHDRIIYQQSKRKWVVVRLNP